jgi:hypothetical protein
MSTDQNFIKLLSRLAHANRRVTAATSDLFDAERQLADARLGLTVWITECARHHADIGDVFKLLNEQDE